MEIKEAAIEDVEEIHNLGENVEEFDTSEQVVLFWPKHILEKCVESKTDWILVAKENSEIVGFVICNYSPVFEKATIENLFVSSNYRGKGIGKMLLDFLMDKIKETDCGNAVLFTEVDNQKAIDFYVNNGFSKGRSFVWMDMILSEEFSRS